VLAGRVIAVALLYSLVGGVGVAATRWLGGPTVVHLAPAVVWAMLAGTVFYLFMLPLSLHASSERGADVLGNLIVFPLALIGGCFMPFEMMPNWMAAIGRVTPNGWAVTQFRAILGGSAEPRSLAIGAACLIAVGAVGFVISVRRMRGAFLR
jgi:ABC-2 type transport system permease protein